MLSRVAEAIYWSNRYVERAENVARFVNVNLNLYMDTPTEQRSSWAPLMYTTGDHEWFLEHYGEPTKEAVTRFLTFDARYPNSIISTVRRARENAQTVREVISREMWQELNELYLYVTETARTQRDAVPEELSDFYDRIKLAGIRFEGVMNATLSHGDAWHFSNLGRMLERADKTSRILDVKYFILLPHVTDVGSNLDQLGWTALLNSASALQMYRQRYHVLTTNAVSEFLIFDRYFPRSMHHCVLKGQESLHAITGSPLDVCATDVERRLGQLRASLTYNTAEQVMQDGLHDFLDAFQNSLNQVGRSIHEHFFELSTPSMHPPPMVQGQV